MQYFLKKNLNKSLEIKRSKFISYSFYVSDIKNLNDYLNTIREKHPDAKHLCFAYSFKDCHLLYEKYHDDNEPKGTAGLPILTLIHNLNISNILIVVVRYFGGVKLGASNLLRAYVNSAKLVIENNLKPLKKGYLYTLNTRIDNIKELESFIRNKNLFVKEKKFTIFNVEFYVLSAFKDLKEIEGKIQINFLKEEFI